VGNKILIVADDQDKLNLLVHSLSDKEYRIYTATDGRNALLQFGLVLPDLIVLDISLPNFDGWETLRRLRELSNVPVIALTAIGEEARIESLHWGADCSVCMPLSVREFNARVQALLRRAKGPILRRTEPQSALI
jgi:two-component system phosphate regulon response regulator OmpR